MLWFSLLNKSITKTWGDVWYNRKCNHKKKKKTRIEIIWVLSTLPGCLRQLHISIELFYDQASMLLKYYLFSLSHSDKKWQALRTVIHTEYKIWSCRQNSAGVKNTGFGEFPLKPIILELYFQIKHGHILMSTIIVMRIQSLCRWLNLDPLLNTIKEKVCVIFSNLIEDTISSVNNKKL